MLIEKSGFTYSYILENEEFTLNASHIPSYRKWNGIIKCLPYKSFTGENFTATEIYQVFEKNREYIQFPTQPPIRRGILSVVIKISLGYRGEENFELILEEEENLSTKELMNLRINRLESVLQTCSHPALLFGSYRAIDASSSYLFYPPEDCIIGTHYEGFASMLSHYWCAEKQESQWIEVQFLYETRICSVALQNPVEGCYVKQVHIEASDDNECWSLVASPYLSLDTSVLLVKFQPVRARYGRITVKQDDCIDSWVRLKCEFFISGPV
jgi:hypothetical protein